MAKVSLPHAIFLSTLVLTFSALGHAAPSVRGLPSGFAGEVAGDCHDWYLYATKRPYEELLRDLAVSSEDFRKLNPSVGPMGQGLIPGKYYCTRSWPTDGSGNKLHRRQRQLQKKPWKPTCPSYYRIKSGDTCGFIQVLYGISAEELFDMNPFVEDECESLRSGWLLCVPKPKGVLKYGLSGLSVKMGAPGGGEASDPL
ncbi:LysM domain-containing protein [Ophiocordyceps camponoti-floridani]|uniref:LysM domain-containing protein n=1 Tax=Ophiocordyceps camponoti-floridani TaxID=2030778 RepID=A0A8H4VCN7_9HYPO|nr:LysM domain-containing protein [Ophiocordyceps camponoti-floridani]